MSFFVFLLGGGIGLGFGYWLGGASPVRITAFVDWIRTKLNKPKGP